MRKTARTFIAEELLCPRSFSRGPQSGGPPDWADLHNAVDWCSMSRYMDGSMIPEKPRRKQFLLVRLIDHPVFDRIFLRQHVQNCACFLSFRR
jgi:hypothetical protein